MSDRITLLTRVISWIRDNFVRTGIVIGRSVDDHRVVHELSLRHSSMDIVYVCVSRPCLATKIRDAPPRKGDFLFSTASEDMRVDLISRPVHPSVSLDVSPPIECIGLINSQNAKCIVSFSGTAIYERVVQYTLVSRDPAYCLQTTVGIGISDRRFEKIKLYCHKKLRFRNKLVPRVTRHNFDTDLIFPKK